jgi:hypothetical protein
MSDNKSHKMAQNVILSPVPKIGLPLTSLLSTQKDRAEVGTDIAI